MSENDTYISFQTFKLLELYYLEKEGMDWQTLRHKLIKQPIFIDIINDEDELIKLNKKLIRFGYISGLVDNFYKISDKGIFFYPIAKRKYLLTSWKNKYPFRWVLIDRLVFAILAGIIAGLILIMTQSLLCNTSRTKSSTKNSSSVKVDSSPTNTAIYNPSSSDSVLSSK